MTPEKIKAISDFIKIASSIIIVLAALCAVIRAFREQFFPPAKNPDAAEAFCEEIPDDSGHIAEDTAATTQTAAADTAGSGQLNEKPLGFIKICAFVFSIGIIFVFIGFFLYLLKNDKENFFHFSKIWSFGDIKTTLNYSHVYGLGKDFLTASFMPLYPFLTGILTFIFRDEFVAGFILSFVCASVACFFICRLAETGQDRVSAFHAMVYFLLSPFAFCLFLPLKYSLFTALAAGFFYFLRRKNHLVAGIFGLLAFLCDFAGIMLLIPLITDIWADRRKPGSKNLIRLIGVSLLPAGIVLFFICLLPFVDPAQFFRIKAALKPEQYFIIIFFCTLAFTGLMFTHKTMDKTHLYYCIGILTLPFFQSFLIIKPSFILYLFPIYIALSSYSENKTFDAFFTAASPAIAGLMLYSYVMPKLGF